MARKSTKPSVKKTRARRKKPAKGGSTKVGKVLKRVARKTAKPVRKAVAKRVTRKARTVRKAGKKVIRRTMKI